MKKTNTFHITLYFANILAALLLVLTYALYYVWVPGFELLSLLGQSMPVLLIVNFLMVLYWLLRFNKRWLLSFIVLLLGWPQLGKTLRFEGTEKAAQTGESLKVMSFNVRLFDLYDWIGEEAIEDKIFRLIDAEDPDILCFQEFHASQEARYGKYPWQYIEYSQYGSKTGQVIFSKFPIVNKGSLRFNSIANNAVYADIKAGNDTLRLYNVHLQSFKLDPGVDDMNTGQAKMLLLRMAKILKKQMQQAQKIASHRQESPYKVIVCGDLNNSPYSVVYRKVKGRLQDSYNHKGSGLGTTYYSGTLPLRIDFIFADKKLPILSHKTIQKKYSDHYPIVSELLLNP